jgi:OmpA-OmpF porin, OOP family
MKALMRTTFALSILLLATGVAAAQAPLKDNPRCKDQGIFTRMPGYFLVQERFCKEIQFDSHEFQVQKGTAVRKQRVEGHKLVVTYEFERSTGPTPSGLQVQRNFLNATLKMGGKTLYSEKSGFYYTTLVLAKNGRETWVELWTREQASDMTLTIIEREAMQQDIAVNADALKGGLAESGHAEVPGIFFDFNKAEVKPESQPALLEIAKLLKGNPTLLVWIVGHTDNVGSADANMKLSGARAASVVAALVQAGIDARRLAPHGAGPFAPVAANTSEEGRARNRRGELVARPQ